MPAVVMFSDDAFPIQNAELMRRAMEYARMLGFPVTLHCEDKCLTRDGVMNAKVRTVLPEKAEHQAKMWLSLLLRLTDVAPDWLAMKGFDSALTGVGDVDSIAPLAEWPVITAEFRRWAVQEGLGPVVICPHAPFLLHLVALSPMRPEFFELDVNRRKVFLGSTLFRPADVAALSVVDQYGVRRLRAQAPQQRIPTGEKHSFMGGPIFHGNGLDAGGNLRPQV